MSSLISLVASPFVCQTGSHIGIVPLAGVTLEVWLVFFQPNSSGEGRFCCGSRQRLQTPAWKMALRVCWSNALDVGGIVWTSCVFLKNISRRASFTFSNSDVREYIKMTKRWITLKASEFSSILWNGWWKRSPKTLIASGNPFRTETAVFFALPRKADVVSDPDRVCNKSQYWPRGAPKHAETAENEKA